MQNVVVNVNGQIRSFTDNNAHLDLRISPFDRSYLYGDSLYEVVRTYGGQFFGLDEHLHRLEASAKLCKMTLKQSMTHYRSECIKTLQCFYEQKSKGEAYCGLIISRGEGRIGFGTSALLTPSLYTIIVQPLEEPTPEQLSKGYRMQISSRLRNDPRALDPAMKSGNYLNSLLAYLEANAAGFDDALLCNHQGFLTEGTTFNLFYIRNGIVATPPLEVGILDGITRRYTLEISHQLGLDCREIRFPRERLYEADEVFLTSTIKEVFPISQVDEIKIGNGEPGPITMKLRKGFQEVIRRSAEMNARKKL